MQVIDPAAANAAVSLPIFDGSTVMHQVYAHPLPKWAAAILAFGQLTAISFGDDIKPSDVEFFEKQVRPILVVHCYECHSTSSSPLQGNLLLDSRPGWQRGGDSGVAIVAGNTDESTLISAINYDSLEMPPSGKLSTKAIATLTKWVEIGAPDPRNESPGKQKSDKDVDWSLATTHWAFQPPAYSTIPAVDDLGWAKGPIDRYVQSRFESNSLASNPRASRKALIQRLTYDLTGLPATADEVSRFINDDHPLADERLVDRLLASPAYGERWARPWLDLARYAEDQAHIVGNNQSLFFPNAHYYRQWAIHALNSDMPYDQFVRFQLAADLCDNASQHVAALGFIGLGPKYYRRNDPAVMADEWEDRVDMVGRGLLGLTIACARCHDHKYDPIETEDYYAIAGVFASTEMFNQPFDDSIKKGKNGHAKDPKTAFHVVREAEKIRNLKVMIRGDVKNLGEEVPRRFVKIASANFKPSPFQHGSGRLELAESIVSPSNPLTSRVWANRAWRELFGQGIVRTTSNFGLLGERPTHPQLLDYLALEFQRYQWSPKRLHRMMALSATYQQSSDMGSSATVDPENRWLARMNRRRLSVEAWRDTVLHAAGRLDRQVGGESVRASDSQETRRTVYSTISRFELDELLALFDFPDPNNHCAGRVETTTPLQKLFLLNSPFMISQADRLANLLLQHSNDDQQRIEYAYELCFARSATNAEKRKLHGFLRDTNDAKAAWQQVAHVLLASNELMYVD